MRVNSSDIVTGMMQKFRERSQGDIIGELNNFRDVDYADFTINFVMVLNTNYAQSIPHQYIATIKLSDQSNFKEFALLENFAQYVNVAKSQR